MAVEQPLFSYTLPAAGDLSASQFCFVVVDGNGRAALPADGALVAGVLQNKPAALGEAATIYQGGIVKVRAGGNFAPGALLQSSVTGRAIAATSGDRVTGIALEAGADGRIVSVLQISQGRLA